MDYVNTSYARDSLYKPTVITRICGLINLEHDTITLFTSFADVLSVCHKGLVAIFRFGGVIAADEVALHKNEFFH